MKLPEKILQAHRDKQVDLNSMGLKEIAEMFDCAQSTASVARKIARKEDKVLRKPYQWEIVVKAHKEGKIDLSKGTAKGIGRKFSMHHSVIHRARQEVGIFVGAVRDNPDPYAWYWCRWRKKYGVFNKWGVIPERVGLTKNQWKSLVREER